MKKRMVISESEREKILSMHKNLIQSTWGINEAEEDEFDIDIQDEPSSDLMVEKFGPLVYLEGK